MNLKGLFAGSTKLVTAAASTAISSAVDTAVNAVYLAAIVTAGVVILIRPWFGTASLIVLVAGWVVTRHWRRKRRIESDSESRNQE